MQIWPLLIVGDVPSSISFYTDRLGFTLVGSAQAEGAVFWCRLERDGASLMLQQADGNDHIHPPEASAITLYFVCDDVGSLCTEFRGNGLSLTPPSLAEYGMRQLFVTDPDGYALCFESPTEDWSG